MKKIFILSLWVVSLLTACSEKALIEVDNLRCEELVNTASIDLQKPRLSWEILSPGRDIRQKSYHILVASSLENLNNDEGDLWNSGNVKSDNSIFVPYEGAKLDSRTKCYWKIKVKTNRGESEWSKPASWAVGLTNPADWKAKWTGLDKSYDKDVTSEYKTRLSARYFRKEFSLSKKIKSATLYISGLGSYEAYINAKHIGEQVLSPTPTDYSKVVKYNSFDVTSQLNDGNNAIGVVLGNGRFYTMRNRQVRNFGFPRMILQLEVNYTDGSSQTIISDDSWKVTADGPILANNEFDGEEYDARKEMPGWNKTGFDDSAWIPAELVDAPGGNLEAQVNRNIKVMETIRPVSVSEIQPGTFVMDMGQNMVGWLRMKVKGKAGDEVKLRFAEMINEDKTLYVANLRSALAADKYILKGDASETWAPSFTYHGFRFVEISGFPGVPTVNDFEGLVVYDEMEVTGEFNTSDKTINQIYKNAYWGIRGNYRGMPTDCPQRDERMGWLGDRAVGSQGESFIFSNNNLYAKWLDDIEQSQRDNGSVPDVAPNYWSVYSDNMTWPGAYVIIANMLYEQYGNREPIEKHYESMKKWINYMQEKYLKDSIMTKDTYGDWCMPPESPGLIHSQDPARKTDGAVLSTTFYFRILNLLEKFAVLLDKEDDAEAFAKQAEIIRNAFNNKYFNKETKQYSNNTVTANLLPLCYGMTPDEYKEDVFKNIVDKTLGEFNGHVSTGLVGIQWLMRGLSEYGRPDIAYKITTNKDYPSWGYMIENGATTIWELWNGNTADPSMNSANHVMLLGDLIVWFYEYLAGIQNDGNSAGFKEIVMKPYPVEGLDYVTASYKSVRGLVKSEWKKSDGRFSWNITVPCNSTATVYIPVTTEKNKVTESGKKASSSKGVKFLRSTDEYRIFRVGSGNYSFNVE
ncbi:MAG: glycoside hydrolase family 78 protein [Prevotellaceae bacterium]|jgi:alpha-L-rhamnosidase|nr:glycoside hydrolase family 78 protein [Prevotellaceae bacterium]